MHPIKKVLNHSLYFLPLSSSVLNHCPILLTNKQPTRPMTHFHFENFWTGMSGFMEIVHQAWNENCFAHQPLRCLKMNSSVRLEPEDLEQDTHRWHSLEAGRSERGHLSARQGYGSSGVVQGRKKASKSFEATDPQPAHYWQGYGSSVVVHYGRMLV